MRERAFAIQGRTAPPREVPEPPRLLPIEDVARISWQGSVGASAYVVERSAGRDGPWTVLADDVSDAALPYEPLLHDPSAAVGESYHHRVRARNVAGVSPPSNVVGPVAVPHATLIDTMRSHAIPYWATSGVSVAAGEDRSFGERRYRRQAPNKSEILYAVPGAIVGFRVQVHAQHPDDPVVVLGSADGRTFGPLPVRRTSAAIEDPDYAYWVPSLYVGEGREDDRYLKIVFRTSAQISRVELDYVP
jgi:hypothetical protein